MANESQSEPERISLVFSLVSSSIQPDTSILGLSEEEHYHLQFLEARQHTGRTLVIPFDEIKDLGLLRAFGWVSQRHQDYVY